MGVYSFVMNDIVQFYVFRLKRLAMLEIINSLLVTYFYVYK